MARPKANTNERTALERIEDTFWQLLSEKNYEKITISELSKKAKTYKKPKSELFNSLNSIIKVIGIIIAVISITILSV